MPARLTGSHLLYAAAALTGIAWSFTPAAGQELRSCTVNGVVGTAHLLGKQGERPIVAGLAIARDDAVVTQADGQIEVGCSDGIVVTIGFATRIELESLVTRQPRDNNVMLRLIDGIAGFLVPEKTFTTFSVETQTAVAAVRSTRWLVDTQAGATDVFVRDGAVSVDPSAGARVLLNPGEGVDIAADGQPGDVKQWGARRIAAVGARLGFSWQ